MSYDEASEEAGPPSLAMGACIGGRYEVEERIGAGGMSVVVRARDLRLGNVVALKVLRRAQRERDSGAARFLREARVIAQLRSDHVVRVLDVDTASDPPYLAMELLEGKDVATLLRARGRFPLDVALRIVSQAARGVAEAHAIGVVHRDLKPSNLIVENAPDGTQRVKVIDFGISKAVVPGEASPDLTSSGQIVGSPRYMSPEQVRGTQVVDARSDVWALGAILYELVAGVPPFDAATVPDTLARIVGETPRPLREHVPDVPARVESLVAMCLQKDAAVRTPSMRALLEELEAIVPSGPLRIDAGETAPVATADDATREGRERVWSVTHAPSVSLPPPVQQRTRSRGVPAIAIAAALVAVGAGAWSFGRRGDAPAVSAAPPPALPAPSITGATSVTSATTISTAISAATSTEAPKPPSIASAPLPPQPTAAPVAKPVRPPPVVSSAAAAPAKSTPATPAAPAKTTAPTDDDLDLGKRD